MPTKVVHKGGATELNFYNTVTTMCVTWESYFQNYTKRQTANHFFLINKDTVQYVRFQFSIGDECVAIRYGNGTYRNIIKGKIEKIGSIINGTYTDTINVRIDSNHSIIITVGSVLLPLEVFYNDVERKLNKHRWKELPNWTWERLQVVSVSQFTIGQRINRALALALIPDNWAIVLWGVWGIMATWIASYEYVEIAILKFVLYEGAYVGYNLFAKKCKGQW